MSFNLFHIGCLPFLNLLSVLSILSRTGDQLKNSKTILFSILVQTIMSDHCFIVFALLHNCTAVIIPSIRDLR